MSDLNQERVSGLVTDALERIAFLTSEPDESVVAPPGGELRHARIRIRGASDGVLVVSADEGFMTTLAASFLGVEPSDVDVTPQGEDALRELANIAGGLVVSEIGGETSKVVLGLPEILDAGETPWNEWQAAGNVGLRCEGHRLNLSWSGLAHAKAA